MRSAVPAENDDRGIETLKLLLDIGTVIVAAGRLCPVVGDRLLREDLHLGPAALDNRRKRFDKTELQGRNETICDIKDALPVQEGFQFPCAGGPCLLQHVEDLGTMGRGRVVA